MMELLHIPSAAIAGALIAATWQGAIIVLATLAGLRLFPSISSAARSVVWTSVLMLVVLLHFSPAFGSARIGAYALTGAGGSAAAFHLDPRWSLALVVLWVAISGVRVVQLLQSALGLRRIARRARHISAPVSCEQLLHHGRRPIALCASEDVDRPSVAGFLHPRILLPSDLTGRLTEVELEHILRHEMEHVHRGDAWVNLLQKLCIVLFPLNPAVLWVEHRLCEERELACDDGVLRATGARKAYATCLSNLAEHSLLRRGVSLALGAWDRPSALARRVNRILWQPARRMSAPVTSLAVTLLIGAATGGAILVSRTPQLVSFAPVARVGTVARMTEGSAAVLPRTAAAGTSSLLRQVSTNVAAPHETLLKAVMPARHSALRTIRTSSGVPTAIPVKAVMMARESRNSRQRAWNTPPRITLTQWQPIDIEPSVTLAVDPNNYFSYAAVRVPNGWLIFQL
jgi:beta-lactamase regulating signal transducer with metallopeptidase domain